ncbi:MAG TPA: S1 RNA-binding domain-containing protein, partial [Candidatus Handelsmanbacteria bacterium]|nr:S1 RNA-binding domain-containing protein [Candidatus Handelsmanbacteria bacterium]
MSKFMLLNIQPDEERVAVVDDQVLTNLEIETADAQTVKGNIYKAVIRKVEPSLQACFVDFGTSKNGFLPRNEIHPKLYDSAGKSGPPPVQEVFKEGQEIMVQVVRDAIGSKGVTFSTYITLAGRYMVMVSDTDRLAISRKLRPSERLRIKKMADSFTLPEGYGIIIRTAA